MKGADAARERQLAAVRRFNAARAAHRVTGDEFNAAWRECRDAGLEHAFDMFGRRRWPEGEGDWRPEAGEPIHA